jgi:hypothetical protein
MSTTEAPESARTTVHTVRPELASDSTALLAVFLGPTAAAPSPKDAARVVNRVGQRDLQTLFQAVYTTPTFSNNNAWLRRKLLEGTTTHYP